MERKLLRCEFLQYNVKFGWIFEKEGDETILTHQRCKKRIFNAGKERRHFDSEAIINLDYFFRFYDIDSWNDLPRTEREEGKEADWVLTLEYDDGIYVLEDNAVLPEKESSLVNDLVRFFNAYHTGSYKTASLFFHSFDGGGATYSLHGEKNGVYTWGTERRYNNPNHDQMCGSGYDLIFTFYPLREGTVNATIKASSPIYTEPDVVIEIKVDKYLNLSYTYLPQEQ